MRKDPDAGKYRTQEEKGGGADNEMVGWRHQLNRHEFGQTLGRTGKPNVLQCIGLQGIGHD